MFAGLQSAVAKVRYSQMLTLTFAVIDFGYSDTAQQAFDCMQGGEGKARTEAMALSNGSIPPGL